MINIADNQIVREQVKRLPSDLAAQEDSSAQTAQPPVTLAYPAKSMVLEGGRYYASKPEK